MERFVRTDLGWLCFVDRSSQCGVALTTRSWIKGEDRVPLSYSLDELHVCLCTTIVKAEQHCVLWRITTDGTWPNDLQGSFLDILNKPRQGTIASLKIRQMRIRLLIVH